LEFGDILKFLLFVVNTMFGKLCSRF